LDEGLDFLEKKLKKREGQLEETRDRLRGAYFVLKKYQTGGKRKKEKVR